MRSWAILITAFLVTGCQSTPNEVLVEKVVERKVEVPSSLLTCSAEPMAGSTWMSQRDVAQYLVKLAAAGQDCRLKLAAVRRLVVTK
jgi:uncharacterized protein YcfL